MGKQPLTYVDLVLDLQQRHKQIPHQGVVAGTPSPLLSGISSQDIHWPSKRSGYSAIKCIWLFTTGNNRLNKTMHASTSNGLQPTSDGLQRNIPFKYYRSSLF